MKKHLTKKDREAIRSAVMQLTLCTELDNTTCSVFKHNWYKPPFDNTNISEEQLDSVRHKFEIWVRAWVIPQLDDILFYDNK